jgi:hypothetical protein
MKRISICTLLVLTIMTIGFSRMARAQSAGQILNQFFNPQNQASQEQLRSFDHFLENHPDMARELRERPERVNDPGFLERHSDFQAWLNDHPDAASAFREDPQGFMERERHFHHYSEDLNSGDEHRRQLGQFDWFLESHSDIRRELSRRPELASRGEYLDNHPELREFLDRHPGIREQLRDNPREFMDRESRFEDNRNH